jgi:hypothetical protein
MNCQVFRTMFDPTSEPPTELVDHLAKCTDCQREMREMQQVRALVASAYPAVAVPVDFDRGVQERLSRLKNRPWHWAGFSGLSVPIAAAAMVVVAVTVALVQFQPNRVTVGPRNEMARRPDAGVESVAAPSASVPATEAAQPSSEMAGSDALLRAESPPLIEGRRFNEAYLLSTTGFSMEGSSSRPIVLIVQDERNKRESVVTIPSMLFGGPRVLTPKEVARNDADNVF